MLSKLSLIMSRFTDEAVTRRQRNIVLSALTSLLLLWSIKFLLPQHTVVTVVESYTWSSNKPDASAAAKVVPPPPSGDFVWQFSEINPTKVAVFIEDRPLPNIIPLLIHFASVLGPTWPIHIYTSLETKNHYTGSAALTRYLNSGQIQLKILPDTTLFAGSDDLSAFLAKPWFWEQLAPAEHVLMFQADSILCSRAARSVEDFFDYDFVGAPIAAALGDGFNGGLSLRRRSTMLSITTEWDYDKTSRGTPEAFEDRWFWKYLHVLMERQEGEEAAAAAAAAVAAGGEAPRKIKIPSMETARTFSVESIDYPHPLGLHQVGRFLKVGQTMVKLDDWCPEYKLCYAGPRLA